MRDPNNVNSLFFKLDTAVIQFLMAKKDYMALRRYNAESIHIPDGNVKALAEVAKKYVRIGELNIFEKEQSAERSDAMKKISFMLKNA